MGLLSRIFLQGLGSDRSHPSSSRLDSLLNRLEGSPGPDLIRALLPEVSRCAGSESDPIKRLDILERLFKASATAVAEVERELVGSALPLPIARMTGAIAADNLIKNLANEYQSVVTILSATPDHPDLANLGRAVLRTVRLLAQRQWLATLAGRAASRTAWRQLHRLHRLAHDAGFAKLAEPAGSIDAFYLRTVLLAVINPIKLPRTDVRWLPDILVHLADRVILEDLRRLASADAKQVLAVGAKEPVPALADPNDASLQPGWRIDLEPAIAELLRHVAPADGQSAERNTGPEIPPRLGGRLLERLRRQPIRRFSRQGARPRVDLVTGMDRLWWALSGPGLSRRRPNEMVLTPEAERQWAIVDESPDGFGVKLLRGNSPQIAIGDLVGLGLRDEGRIHVCIVRRLTEEVGGRCRLGLQTLAPDASAVVVLAQEPSRQEAAILLPRLPAHGNRPGIAFPSGHLAAGAPLRIVDGESDAHLTIGKRLEANHQFEMFLLEAHTAMS